MDPEQDLCLVLRRGKCVGRRSLFDWRMWGSWGAHSRWALVSVFKSSPGALLWQEPALCCHFSPS